MEKSSNLDKEIEELAEKIKQTKLKIEEWEKESKECAEKGHILAQQLPPYASNGWYQMTLNYNRGVITKKAELEQFEKSFKEKKAEAEKRNLVKQKENQVNWNKNAAVNKMLRFAAEDGNLEELKEALIKGANINAEDDNGKTALHHAAMNGHLLCVKYLLQNEANPQLKFVDLRDIALKGHLDCINELVRWRKTEHNIVCQLRGMALYAQGHYREALNQLNSALEYNPNDSATKEFIKIINKRLTSIDEPKLNIKTNPPQPNIVSDNKNTLFNQTQGNNNNTKITGATLLSLIEKQQFDQVKSALLKDTDVTYADNLQRTPLHWIAWYGNVEIAQLLLNKGAKVNAQNWVGWTPLHLAIYRNQPNMVNFLLQNGADPNIKSSDKYGYNGPTVPSGKTAHDVAKICNYQGPLAINQTASLTFKK